MNNSNHFSTKELAAQVGSLLRKVRNERQLTLEELAKKTGVSKLTLGKIERGEGNPTLTVIWKIANSLSIPISSLLSIERNVKISRNGEGFKVHSNDQACVLEPVFHSNKHGSFEIHRAVIKPQNEYHPGPHQPGVVEYVTVMKGEIIITIEGEPHHLYRYDSIQFNADCDHKYNNLTSSETVLHFVMGYNHQKQGGFPFQV